MSHGVGDPADPVALRSWLVEALAAELGVPAEGIDPGRSFHDHGVSSSAALSLCGALEDRLNRPVPPATLFEYPTVDALVAALGTGPAAERATAPRPGAGPAEDPVCVVGIGCRFPGGADDPGAFWRALLAGTDGGREVPADRWDAATHQDAVATTRGGYLADLAGFDADFFGISPAEALRMDPQHRQLIEVAWAALEDAGVAADRLRGSRTGVFVGMMTGQDYLRTQTDADRAGSLADPYLGYGSAPSVAAGRLSYLLDLRGPSLCVDTACSSSLLAVHLAAASLRRGECELALAGGVSAISHPDVVAQAYRAHMLAGDGRCKTFDAAADGFLIAEGCGVVVLERQSAALASGHRVLAVLRGSAVGQDGRSNGMTAPNPAAQVEVIRAALATAGVAAAQVGYVETHGSGTALGDAVEVSALHEVFAQDRDPARPLVLGAVKTNLGHLLGAAGVAGLVKAVLAVRHGVVPANLHLTERNPAIDWARCPVLLPDRPVAWPAGGPRIAGVSSFGWSGTNVHVVLESAPPPQTTPPPRAQAQLLRLSAADGTTLAALAHRLRDTLAERDDLTLADVAHTLRVGRARLDHRLPVVCRDRAAALTALDAVTAADGVRVPPGERGSTVFLFPGTGDHHVGMGRGLYETEPAFRDGFDECAVLARPVLGADLRELVYPEETTASGGPDLAALLGRAPGGAAGPLRRAELAHTAVFAVEYAMARLWRDRGVRPGAVFGYSLGEYAAACVAGVFTPADAVRIVARRARLMGTLPPGAMLAVPLAAAELTGLLPSGVSVAAYNGPEMSVVAGPVTAVESLERVLDARDLVHRRVNNGHALHTPALDPIRDEVAALVADAGPAAPRIPLLSSRFGDWLSDEQARDPEYWAAQLCEPVRFEQGLRVLADRFRGVALEIGPGQTLSSLTGQVLGTGADAALLPVPTLRPATVAGDDRDFLLRAAGRHWAAGGRFDPEREAVTGRLRGLPTYPFRHQRFWPAPVTRPAPLADGKLADRSAWCHVPVWRQSVVPAGTGDLAGDWLLCAGNPGLDPLREPLADALRDAGARVTWVTPGAAFGRTEDDTYTTDLADPSGCRALAEGLRARDRLPTAVLHTGAGPFLPLTHLLAALGGRATRLRLYVLSADAQDVLPGEAADPDQATALGLARTVAQEYPGSHCRLVDLAGTEVRARPVDTAAALVAELRDPDAAAEVALRGGRRWVREWRPAPLPDPGDRAVWRAGGTYVITGGFGELGLALARTLATRYRPNLVLLGRHPLAPEHDPGAARRAAAVRELTGLGARVLPLALDVADPAALTAALHRVRAEFGPVHGVVHAAGVPGGGLLALKSAQDVRRVFHPKAGGAAALTDALRATDSLASLDFLVLYSSSVVALGGIGESDYCAANAHLGALAHRLHAAGVPVTAVDWGPWQRDAWTPSGGAGVASVTWARLRALRDRYGITDDEGVDLLTRVVAAGLPQVLVVPQTPELLAARWREITGPELGNGAQALPHNGNGNGAGHPRPQLRTPYVAPRTALERRISEVWRQYVGVDRVGVDDQFFELGGTSLIGLTIVARLSEELGVPLTAADLFTAPTPAALAGVIAGRLGDSQDGADTRPPGAAPPPRREIPVTEPDGTQLESTVDDETAVAVVGMACRFPGAPDVDRYWRNLRDGVESIRRFTDAELTAAGVDAVTLADPAYVKAAPVLDGIDLFDAGFFGFTPAEARIADPQQRLFLEVAWSALEAANCDPSRFPGAVGVYAGSALSTYLLNNLIPSPEVAEWASPMQLALGNDKDSLCTRVGYAFDLRGPCYSVQSYCSSSLVAVSAACTALVAGDCDVALAGGVSVSVPHHVGYPHQAGGIASADGHCRAFDADADGAPLGSGAGVVVLRRLADARAAGDHVHAVIRGWAVNNDGGLKAGYTAPGVHGQTEVISEALAAAGVAPAGIDFLEAHGTGTALGDAAEFAALLRAFGDDVERGSCVLGSVKTNMGHLDRAAGIAGLIKAVLALEHREMPPTLHFQRPNPATDLANSPFRIEPELTTWPRREHPRRAGVSAFGIGGTNAHVVLEEAPTPPATVHSGRPEVLVLSARTPAALAARTADLAQAMATRPELDLADVAHTLRTGRKDFEHRRAAVVTDRAEAARLLADPGAEGWLTGPEPVPGREVTLLCTGIAEPLTVLDELSAEPAFAAAVAECAAAAPDASPRAAGPVAAFAAEYALGRLLRSWGVRPALVTGQGPGEYVAAALSGLIALPDVLSLPAFRAGASPEGQPPVSTSKDLPGRGEPDRVVIRLGTSPVAEPVVSLLPDAGANGPAAHTALHTAVARLWLAGVQLDWDAYAAGQRRRRVPLPTYPFQRQRYWVNAPSTATGTDAPDWYVPHWRPAEPAEAGAVAGPVLLFGSHPDRNGSAMDATAARLTEALIARLDGQTPCTTVLAGAAFAELAEDTFVVRPDAAADHERLAGRLTELARLPRTALHTWTVTGPDTDPTAPDTLRGHRRLGFDSLICLVRALAERVGGQLDVVVAADHLHDADGRTSLSPGKAAALGVCLVAPQEHPNVRCRSVDVTGVPHAEAAGWLLREPAAPGPPAVAYRAGVRLIEDHVPAPALTDPVPAAGHRFLITGGLGNIGLLLAEHLAATRPGVRLALLGRTALPPRSSWPALAELSESDGPDAVAGRRVRRLLALEAAGVEVLVPDPADGGPAVAAAARRFGGFDVVVHAAGLTDPASFQPIQALTEDTACAHFTAKVDSLRTVLDGLAGHGTGVHVLFSSTSTVLGGLGFAAYAGANAVLDALARHGCRTGRWTSVAWDTWRFTADQLAGATLGAAMAENSMSVAAGLAAFDRALHAELPTAVVAAGDLATRRREWVTGGESGPEPTAPAVPLSAGEYERRLVALWRDILGIDAVGRDDNFFDLGGTSLMGLQLVKRVGREFGITVPAVALFAAPTVAACARYLLERNGGTPAEPAAARERAGRRRDRDEDGIAVIGMAGRFPGAPDVDRFWQNLRDGVESIRFFTREELLAAGVPAEELARDDYVPARPVLDDVDLFDAGFFGYSPKEAALTDPQHRVFLECCWHALEHAGYGAARWRGEVGVFAGTNISTYLHRMAAGGALDDQISDYQVVIGNDKDSLTTAVSYKLDLTGPSMAVQTFCSTSLVAVHLAAASLRGGECDMALAGGVSIRVPDRIGHRYTEGGMESPDGHVRTFDAEAHGSMFGDGAGVVVLKRLADALADGDTVQAVIRGSAVNNDGSLKVGFTAPSVTGQAAVIARALADADVAPETVSYLEAHGTATELGDPIEMAALTKAFGDGPERGSCAIGSVKTNVGHLDRAAGVSGLIKVVLSLRHRELPPSLHYTAPNPEIDFAASPFRVNTERREWAPRPGHPRRAGINSLGMGGTNVHVVVEEAPEPEPTTPGRDTQLLVLSARNPEALDAAAADLARHLRAHPELDLADVANTLQVGREVFAHRRLIRCVDRAEALAALDGDDPARVLGRHEPLAERPVGFLLAGVGEHYPGMAAELDAAEPVFRAAIDECHAVLDPLLGLDLRELFFTAPTAPQETDLRALLGRGDGTGDAATDDQLTRTVIAQPAVFAVEYALARLLMSWGVRPDSLAGYSVGEYVAATLAGVLSLPDALRLVAHRARLIDDLPHGAMLAVSESADRLRPLLDARVDLAAVNAPGQCVLAGPREALDRVAARLSEREIAHRMLDTEHAFHSAMLEPAAGELTAWVWANVTLSAPRLPYVSNVTGTWITAGQATDPAYWARHMCGTVRFADAVGAVLAEPDRVLVELGPGQSLGAFVRQHPDCGRERMSLIVPTLPARTERTTAAETAHAALGRLWLAGVPVDWDAYHDGERRRRVPLPGYPFQRERYWLADPGPANRRPAGGPVVDLSGNPRDILTSLPRKELDDWYYLPSWRRSAAPSAGPVPADGPWLVFADEHGVADAVTARITAAGGQVVRVTAGAAFTTTEDGAFAVRPNSSEDHTTLVGKVRPRYVLYLWTLDDPPPEVADPAEWLMERSYFGPLWLAKALGQTGLGQRDLLVATAGACNVTGADEVVPERATVSGPCKIVPLELPDVTCRQVDVRRPGSTAQAAGTAERLLGELAADPGQQLVAWRGNRRWVAGFDALPAPDAAGVDRLRERGVYLITGGLGGIGLAIARGLARDMSARLVLLGRSPLPPRETWLSAAADPATPAEVRRRIEAVRDLEAAGAEVLVVAADVSDAPAVRAAVRAAVDRFGALHGVVHAAGVPGMGLLQFKEPDNAAIALAPKVTGTRALLSALAELSEEDSVAPDFVALFSSITSVTGGGPGQVDYCAANSYLDGVAQRADVLGGTRTFSVNWAEWRWNAWGDGLSGFAPEVARFFTDNRDRVGITFDEGWQAFLGVLGMDEPQVVVSPQDFPVLAELSHTFTIETVLSLGLESRGRHARPELGTSYVAPGTDLERRIARIWSDSLGVADVGVHDNFFELGGNSLLGVDLIARVRRELGQDELAPHVLYLAPTVGALAEFVAGDDAVPAGRPDAPPDMRARGALRRQGLRMRRNR